MKKRRPSKFGGRTLSWRDDRGSELLEFAAASVVFFAVLFGTIEFGLGVWQYNMTADLAQEGARWAAVHGKASASPATAAQLQAYVQGRSPGFSVVATAVTASATADPKDGRPGEVISVQVNSTFSPVTNLIPSTTLNLTSTAKMTVFR
jgi:Flp pilus assembly protein TadG